MNKVFPVTGISVLAVGFLVTGGVLFQNVGNLSDARETIKTHEVTIASLETSLAASQAESSDYQMKLTASEEEAVSLKIDMTTLEGEITSLNKNLDGTKAELDGVNSLLTSTRSQLTSVQADLKATQTINTALTAELRKIKDARHFTSLEELTSWLQKDDTNTKYDTSTMSYIQMAFILQERAARDGYLLPAYIIIGTTSEWVSNYCIIGDMMYVVEPGDDSVTAWARLYTAQPSHPEPLP